METNISAGKKIIKYIFMGTFLILSVVNITLFVFLFNIKSQISNEATQAASMVQQIQTQPLTTPFAANVAVDNTFSIPIKTTVPIKTTLNIPVTNPVTGQQVNIAIPIDTNVPIDMTIQVPVKTTIPVNIKVSDSPFGNILQQVHDWLIKLSTSL